MFDRADDESVPFSGVCRATPLKMVLEPILLMAKTLLQQSEIEHELDHNQLADMHRSDDRPPAIRYVLGSLMNTALRSSGLTRQLACRLMQSSVNRRVLALWSPSQCAHRIAEVTPIHTRVSV